MITALTKWRFQKLLNRTNSLEILTDMNSVERLTDLLNRYAEVADLPADLRNAFEERIATAEFDGGLDRAAAERLARAEVTGEAAP